MMDEGVRGNLVLGRSAVGRPGAFLRRRSTGPLRSRSRNTMSREMRMIMTSTTKRSTKAKSKMMITRVKTTRTRTELPKRRLRSRRSQPERVGVSSRNSRITTQMSSTMTPCSMAEGTEKSRELLGKCFWASQTRSDARARVQSALP